MLVLLGSLSKVFFCLNFSAELDQLVTFCESLAQTARNANGTQIQMPPKRIGSFISDMQCLENEIKRAMSNPTPSRQLRKDKEDEENEDVEEDEEQQNEESNERKRIQSNSEKEQQQASQKKSKTVGKRCVFKVAKRGAFKVGNLAKTAGAFVVVVKLSNKKSVVTIRSSMSDLPKKGKRMLMIALCFLFAIFSGITRFGFC